jgi:hypothetical protein
VLVDVLPFTVVVSTWLTRFCPVVSVVDARDMFTVRCVPDGVFTTVDAGIGACIPPRGSGAAVAVDVIPSGVACVSTPACVLPMVVVSPAADRLVRFSVPLSSSPIV